MARGDEEQGQLVDLGLVVFDPEILLVLRAAMFLSPAHTHVRRVTGGMSRISSVLTLQLPDPVDGDGDITRQVDPRNNRSQIMKPVENVISSRHL